MPKGGPVPPGMSEEMEMAYRMAQKKERRKVRKAATKERKVKKQLAKEATAHLRNQPGLAGRPPRNYYKGGTIWIEAGPSSTMAGGLVVTSLGLGKILRRRHGRRCFGDFGAIKNLPGGAQGTEVGALADGCIRLTSNTWLRVGAAGDFVPKKTRRILERTKAGTPLVLPFEVVELKNTLINLMDRNNQYIDIDLVVNHYTDCIPEPELHHLVLDQEMMVKLAGYRAIRGNGYWNQALSSGVGAVGPSYLYRPAGGYGDPNDAASSSFDPMDECNEGVNYFADEEDYNGDGNFEDEDFDEGEEKEIITGNDGSSWYDESGGLGGLPPQQQFPHNATLAAPPSMPTGVALRGMMVRGRSGVMRGGPRPSMRPYTRHPTLYRSPFQVGEAMNRVRLGPVAGYAMGQHVGGVPTPGYGMAGGRFGGPRGPGLVHRLSSGAGGGVLGRGGRPRMGMGMRWPGGGDGTSYSAVMSIQNFYREKEVTEGPSL